jgi:hypothetical protein
MPYKVFLIDELNYVELDTENLDITTVFSVATYKDISVRKDNITKSVVFKGTKGNNAAFGSLFHLNKTVDTTLTNRLFFNYTPLRSISCVVYEDSMLVFKGSLRVIQVNISMDDQIFYETVITGNFIDFNNIVQDKYLADLDFSDLKHRYNSDVIFNSWDTQLQVTNSFGQQIIVPFEKGKGYLYPFIDYGYLFKDTASNADVNNIQILNFKPAIYVKEYFNRIFSQPGLAGFTYEIKGSSEFQDKFNSLVIPDADDSLNYTFTGFFEKFSKSPASDDHENGSNASGSKRAKLLLLNTFLPPPANTINPYITYYGSSRTILYVDRSVTTDASVNVLFSSLHCHAPSHFHVQLVERNESTGTNALNDWTVIADTKITVGSGDTLTNKSFSLSIGERRYEEGKQLGLRVYTRALIPVLTPPDVDWVVASAELRFPKDEFTTITADIRVNDGDNSDLIAPKVPVNVKQIDFLKSVINLMNMYVYTTNENPKHLIFQKYDDYYAFATPENIRAGSLNWTNKIDLNGELKFVSNLTIPRSYQFTYKEDSDFLNSEYKNKYGELYGSFAFNDTYGVTDTQKLELIFSPTPPTQYSDSDRLHPALYKINNSTKQAAKTNIRILYYNGVKESVDYVVGKDTLVDDAWTLEEIATKTAYGQVTDYWYNEINQPVEYLHFGRPKELYFPASAQHINADTAYHTYYSNKITELTNPNLFLVECKVLLNELDIANLDLKIPVFVDLGQYGHSYFKILKLEYINNYTPAEVLLQKIVLGVER